MRKKNKNAKKIAGVVASIIFAVGFVYCRSSYEKNISENIIEPSIEIVHVEPLSVVTPAPRIKQAPTVTPTPEPTVTPTPTLEPTPTPAYVEYVAPETSGFKSWMSYTAITLKSSPQYIMQTTQAYTGEYGIRQVDGRFCIALGSHFTTKIGTYVDLVLENGTVIECILGDQKNDIHTDENNIVTVHNGCMSEFIIDPSVMDDYVKKCGDISVCNDNWRSPVAFVRVYENREE